MTVKILDQGSRTARTVTWDTLSPKKKEKEKKKQQLDHRLNSFPSLNFIASSKIYKVIVCPNC